ncbi:UNVERIFIED_CONTAM: hypothetical protein Scaly_1032800 [Sesamum calycinum]|uniref:Uncharacterized protein n=1 Tax=Sesamum calycinum TaxID=2727403 RepID=A0AAW2QKE5_9LAMI
MKARGANGIRYPRFPFKHSHSTSSPSRLDIPRILLKERGAFGNADTGGARLSLARAARLPVISQRKVKDDVKSSCPLCPGRHTCYNSWDKGSRSREGELTPKTRPQFRLQAASRLHEAIIASNRGRPYGGEFVPGPCTPVRHIMGAGHAQSRYLNRKEGMPKAGLVTGVKSYQGSRTGRCG